LGAVEVVGHVTADSIRAMARTNVLPYFVTQKLIAGPRKVLYA
jgi:hypothetical protein